MRADNLSAAENKMATAKLSTLVIRYSLPTIIGMLVNSLYNTVDRLWVGRIPDVGSTALAGIGLCFPIMNLIMAFCQLVGLGAAARISIRLGQKDYEGAEKIIGNCLSLIIIISICFSILGLIFSEPLMRLMGATDETLPYALPYIRIIIGCSIFQMASFAMNHPIRAAGNPSRFALTQMVGGVSNIILDPIFIFVFGMGIAGAAVATVISQAISAVLVFAYYFSPDTRLKIKRVNLRPELQTVKVIFSIGIAPFLMQIANSVTTAVANVSLVHYGNIAYGEGGGVMAVSAMTIVGSISMLFLMPLFGINQGTQPIIGYNFGAKQYDRVKEAYKWAVVYAVAITIVGLILVESAAPALVWLFNDDPLLLNVGSRALRIVLVMLPLVGFQVPSTNFFTAVGQARLSIVLSLLRQVILLIPLYLLLPLILGFDGLLFSGPIADLIAAAVTMLIILREFRRLNKLKSTI